MKTKAEILATVEPKSVKMIGFINSWGPNVGHKGWQFLSEKYFTTGNVLSGWAHIFNPNLPFIGFTHNFTTDLKYGMSGDEVKALQTALQLEGVFPQAVPATTYFGGITLDAVKKFQVKYTIVPAAGFCGPITRAKLNSIYNH